jgi:hypothetical protein
MATINDIYPKPPDLGPEASSGFQSGPRTASRPYTRDNRRSEAVNGGGFQTTIKRDDERLFVSNLRESDETTND